MLCAPSSAFALTAAGVSAGCKVRFIANIMTRVRLSLPQLSGEVIANGSRVCVTESTAMARVDVSWLTSFGAELWATVFGEIPVLIRSNAQIKAIGTHHMLIRKDHIFVRNRR